MLRRFLGDERGNFLMLTAVAMVVLFGALTVGVDYAQMSRQRQNTLNALDAAGIATARRILEGTSTDAQVKQYARDFFDANLSGVRPQDVVLTVTLPNSARGGGRVRLEADLLFQPHFLPAFLGLMGREPKPMHFRAANEVQLRNTVEVALVLDNSGSMSENGKGTGKPRIDLLKTASTQLVDQLAATAEAMTQVERPVQFSLIPFAASVNVGPDNANASWMDTQGASPIHHENFDWTTMTGTKKVTKGTDGLYHKTGGGWAGEENAIVTRFTLLGELKRYVCSGSNCSTQIAQSANQQWGGCVETRPYPYNTNDDAPVPSNPATLFVPMFAPDEAGDYNSSASSEDYLVSFGAYTSWWNDFWTNNTVTDAIAKARQRSMVKYFTPLPRGTTLPSGEMSPNRSCTTKKITPLTDVSTAAGKKTVKDAINAMSEGGATNVPEGLAWGWRTLSSHAPFTEGRPEVERGNDKVVIVLTDGANTYYTPDSLGYSDRAGNKSIYSAYGYARLNGKTNPNDIGRIFDGTSSPVVKGDYQNSTYTKAMNQHFLKLCENANGGDTGGVGAGLIVMTVALDLDVKVTADKDQMAMLEKCASRSRYVRDSVDPTKGRKLYWNATGANLNQVFREIGDELSNLRLVM